MFPKSNCSQYSLATSDFPYGTAGCEDTLRNPEKELLIVLSCLSTAPCASLGTTFSRTSSVTFMAFEGNTRSLCVIFFPVSCETQVTKFWKPSWIYKGSWVSQSLWSKQSAWQQTNKRLKWKPTLFSKCHGRCCKCLNFAGTVGESRMLAEVGETTVLGLAGCSLTQTGQVDY